MSYKYRNVYINGNTVNEHKYIWESHNGKIPSGYEIHHSNGNKKDNRIENLSLIPRKEHTRIHRFFPLFHPNSTRNIFKLGYTNKGYDDWLTGLPSKLCELLKNGKRVCDIIQEWDTLFINANNPIKKMEV